jgi:YXWGXW repeat-containing protein
MRSEKLLACLLTAGAALSAAPVLTGCAGEAYVVADEPPAPQYETVVYRPGFVWVEGHWYRRGHDWRWRSGYYERERPNMVYVHGRWDRRGRSYVWVDGGWRQRASVTVHGRL